MELRITVFNLNCCSTLCLLPFIHNDCPESYIHKQQFIVILLLLPPDEDVDNKLLVVVWSQQVCMNTIMWYKSIFSVIGSQQQTLVLSLIMDPPNLWLGSTLGALCGW